MVSKRDSEQADTASIEYLNGLYGYAMILTQNQAEAEDLVQETYVQAVPAMLRLTSEGNIKGGLFKILREIWIDQPGERQADSPTAQPYMTDGCTNNEMGSSGVPCNIPINKLETEQLRATIQKLPREFREVILLREFEEFSCGEIAGLLDCPTGTVRSRLAKARLKLRVLLSSVLPIPRPTKERFGNNSFLQ